MLSVELTGIVQHPHSFSWTFQDFQGQVSLISIDELIDDPGEVRRMFQICCHPSHQSYGRITSPDQNDRGTVFLDPLISSKHYSSIQKKQNYLQNFRYQIAYERYERSKAFF